jgi:hypothetical protein
MKSGPDEAVSRDHRACGVAALELRVSATIDTRATTQESRDKPKVFDITSLIHFVPTGLK